MTTSRFVLVTGGAGYIGSHTAKALHRAGFTPVVYDDLSNGHRAAVRWGPLVVGAFSAFLLGGLFSLVLVITRRANRKSSIPFGPWMLAGAWLGIFGGDVIAAGYLALYGLT